MIKKILYFLMIICIIALCITTIIITYTLKSPYELMISNGDLQLDQFNDADNFMVGYGKLVDKRYYSGIVTEEEDSVVIIKIDLNNEFTLNVSLNDYIKNGETIAINGEEIILSPINGKVVEILNKGNNCYINLLDFSKLRIEFSINSELYANINYKSIVNASFGDYQFDTNIEFIDYKINNGSFKIRVNYNDIEHVTCPGLDLKVELILFQKENCLIVPKQYLRQNSQGNYLIVNEHGKYTYKNVKVGRITESEVEIISGVTAGQIICFPNDGKSN